MRAVALLLTLGALGYGAPAAAQGPVRGGGAECVLRPGPNGVIRGDQVPTGCVITSAPRERAAPERAAGLFVGSSVVFVPVLVSPRVFLSDPPFIGVLPGSGAVAGADSLPRVRSGPFGPIERPFGPVTQPFRPTATDFGRVTPPPAPDP